MGGADAHGFLHAHFTRGRILMSIKKEKESDVKGEIFLKNNRRKARDGKH